MGDEAPRHGAWASSNETERVRRRDGALASSAYPQRRRPRLPAFGYVGCYAYHVILTTSGRAAHFGSSAFARASAGRLRQVADRLSFRLLAYCFMPDHVHALVLGRDDSANLLTFVQRFKQVSAYRYKRLMMRQLWQRSYFEHVLRHEDDARQIAAYIWENRVRAGLAADRDAYPFSGPSEAMGPDRPEGLSLRSPRLAGVPRG